MWIETEDIYKDQAKRSDIFDLNYLENLFLIKNKIKESLISKSIYLKPKIYLVFLTGYDPKTSNNPNSENPKKKHNI